MFDYNYQQYEYDATERRQKVQRREEVKDRNTSKQRKRKNRK